jgi:hypothetical protein
VDLGMRTGKRSYLRLESRKVGERGTVCVLESSLLTSEVCVWGMTGVTQPHVLLEAAGRGASPQIAGLALLVLDHGPVSRHWPGQR